MLAYIKGVLAAVTEDGVVLENNGIGYDIRTPDLSGELPMVGSPCTIYTYLYVREDMICLYGFSSRSQLETFKLLLTVNGIGPKVAMGILSSLTVEQIHFAILSDDSKTIAKAPGIGPKGAKKLILELRDKLDLGTALEDLAAKEGILGAGNLASDAMGLAAQGLVGLGYSCSEALRAVQAVEGAEGMDEEALLKEALKKILTI